MVKRNFVQKTVLIIWGILLGAVLLEAALRIGGFAIIASRRFADGILRGKHSEYRILCLGESTTYDGGIYCYPNQLETILNNKRKDIKFEVINNGIPGITTEGIVEKLEDNLNKYNPDMVITMMGINDESGNLLREDLINKKDKAFFKKFRIYKLIRLLQYNIINRNENLKNLRKNPGFESKTAMQKTPDLKEKQKILMLENGLKNNPLNYSLISALERCYKREERFDKLEQMYKRLINMAKTDNDRIKLYVDLARFYQEHRMPEEIEKMYTKAIKGSPGFVRLYCELAIYYRDRGKYPEAERLYEKAIRTDPKNSIIYGDFGDCYKKQGRDKEAEQMYRKAKDLHPEHISMSNEIRGREYRETGKYDEIEKIYKKILKIDPGDAYSYCQLAKCYEKQGKAAEAEEMYKKYVEFLGDYYMKYAALALFYQKQGCVKLAEKYFKKRDKISFNWGCNPGIGRNYRNLKKAVLKRGMKLVCVQYPMRNAEVLKKVLGLKDGIIFVDNESVFRDAVEKRGYKAYFVDCFAGDFGHCTWEGNRLLADNIANAVIRGVFTDKPNIIISGRIIYDEFKKGDIELYWTAKLKHGDPMQEECIYLSRPGPYELKIPRDYGNVYICSRNKGSPHESFAYFISDPVKIGRDNIKNYDISLKTNKLLMDGYKGETVSLSGRILCRQYKKGVVVVCVYSPDYYKKIRLPPDIAKAVLPAPGDFDIEIPADIGEVYIVAINIPEGESSGNSPGCPRADYNGNPVFIEDKNIKGIDIIIN